MVNTPNIFLFLPFYFCILIPFDIILWTSSPVHTWNMMVYSLYSSTKKTSGNADVTLRANRMFEQRHLSPSWSPIVLPQFCLEGVMVRLAIIDTNYLTVIRASLSTYIAPWFCNSNATNFQGHVASCKTVCALHVL